MIIKQLNDVNSPAFLDGYKPMLDIETIRRSEMDEYIKKIEKKIHNFKHCDSASKIETMQVIIQLAEQFVEYYTEK